MLSPPPTLGLACLEAPVHEAHQLATQRGDHCIGHRQPGATHWKLQVGLHLPHGVQDATVVITQGGCQLKVVHQTIE